MTLEEMITVTPLMSTIRGFQELLLGIDTEPSLDPGTSEELYLSIWEIFKKTLKETLPYKALLLWSDPDYASVFVLESDEECAEWIKDAERLFEENPIPDSDDPELDELHGVTGLPVRSALNNSLNLREMNFITLTITLFPKRGLSSLSRIAHR